MQKILLVLVAGILLIAGFYAVNNFIYNEKQADEEAVVVDTNDEANYSTITDREAGLAFEYKTSPDGYVVEDVTETISGAPDGTVPLRIYSIMNAREKAELEASTEGREGPPSMRIALYPNDSNLSASAWVDAFAMQSNIGLVMGEVDRDAVVGGANAVRYFTDGLYVSENVVVAHGDFIYHFSGAFLESGSTIHEDFKVLVDSVTFVPRASEQAVPPAGSGAKIDVRVACQSALAYMLFQSSEQSDQFIEECIAGEHPDVIDRYIESLGLDGATI